MKKFFLLTTSAVLMASAASAADMNKPPLACGYVTSEVARLETSRSMRDRQVAASMRANRPDCYQVAYKAPEPVPYIQPVSLCGGGGLSGGNGGSRFSPYIKGAASFTTKHMNDASTGVDKSDLDFVAPSIGAGVCMQIAPQWSAFLEGEKQFATGKVDRMYPSGWKETDQFSMITGRVGAMYHWGSFALGPHLAIAQGTLKYDQNLVWGVKNFNINGTSDGTLGGVGIGGEWTAWQNVAVFGLYEHLWLLSDVPAGANKTDIDKIQVGVKVSF